MGNMDNENMKDMKRNFLIMMVALGGLMVTGCFFGRGIDETIETDRYSLHMQSDEVWDYDEWTDDGWMMLNRNDTLFMCYNVPDAAVILAARSDVQDSMTMHYCDQHKRYFLPKYIFTIVDRDTTQPQDYTPLLHAMIKRGILQADTTYEPLRLLEVYDTVRFAAHKKQVKEENAESCCHVQMKGGGKVSEDESFQSLGYVASNLQHNFRIPVIVAPEVDPNVKIEFRFMEDERKTVDSWLDSMGMRIVSDPQNRKMRVIEFNRCKGKI